jgi:hypothetical protein
MPEERLLQLHLSENPKRRRWRVIQETNKQTNKQKTCSFVADCSYYLKRRLHKAFGTIKEAFKTLARLNFWNLPAV